MPAPSEYELIKMVLAQMGNQSELPQISPALPVNPPPPDTIGQAQEGGYEPGAGWWQNLKNLSEYSPQGANPEVPTLKDASVGLLMSGGGLVNKLGPMFGQTMKQKAPAGRKRITLDDTPYNNVKKFSDASLERLRRTTVEGTIGRREIDAEIARRQKAPESRGKIEKPSAVANSSVKTAILVPWSRRRSDGSFETGFQWETPGGKQLSGSFGSEALALKNKPNAQRHLDEAYQPFAADVQSVKPRAEPPRLNMVRGSGRPEEVVLKFDKTDKPLSLAEVKALFPKSTIEKLGLDAVFDAPGTQKFRLSFESVAEAQAAQKAFGVNVQPKEPSPDLVRKLSEKVIK